MARKKHLVLSSKRISELAEMAALTHRLADGLQNHELFIVVQPKIGVRNGQVTGGEVLVRWQRPDGSFVRPDLFIPAAESSGLINSIGRFVFLEGTALAQQITKSWALQRKLAINVSPSQLYDYEFVRLVERTFKDFNVDPRAIEFEVTETAVAAFPERVKGSLKDLRALGSTIALDDFGTGQSSLTMLRDLPLDRVKLDRSFLAGLEHDDNAFKLVENSIRMMRDLGYQITVEGVETREMHDMLYALGAQEAQGYFYSKPLPVDQFMTFEFSIG
jgi:EAL domain-containing protein (putative c-di-GMP-specific phosphodiesterase class I)